MDHSRDESRSMQAEPATAAFVGRSREREELETALKEARTGRGSLFLLAGEPGIGKTSLAEALAAHAEGAGVSVFWGRCWENPGAPAYWPWAQVLRSLARTRDDAQLGAEVGAGASWLAQIVPELGGRVPRVGTTASLSPDQARFALFDAIASFLREAATAAPLVIVLDDLHAADAASLLLLEFVARGVQDAPILLLGAYQEAAMDARSDLRGTMGRLLSEGRRIVLRGFARDELARLIEQCAGGPAPAELVRALHDTTEGNPLFTSEVVRLLRAEHQLELWAAGTLRARFPLPDTVRETILRRFEPLGTEGVRTLEAAAVIGRKFRLTTLEQVTGAERQALIDLLDMAVAAGLVVPVPGAIGRFNFTHALIRETLYASLGTRGRVRLHRAVGEALERTYGLQPERLPELAYHFAEAAPGGDASKALELATRAGLNALGMLSYEQAAQFLALALEVSELLPPDPERRAGLLLELGRARTLADDPSARETLIAAARAASAIDRPALAAQAALAIHVFNVSPGRPDEDAIALLEEALERTGTDDRRLRARLLARLATALYYRTDSSERRESLVAEAIAIARELDEPEVLAYVLSNCQLATWGPDSTERGLAWVEELLELSREVGSLELAVTARIRQVDYLLELDDVAGADAALDALERMAGESREPRARAYLPVQRARRAAIEGRYEESERLNDEARRVAASLEDRLLVLLVDAQRAMLHWFEGRLGEAEDLARHWTEAAPDMPAWHAVVARALCDAGRAADARRELERLSKGGFAALPRYNGWLVTMALLAEVCATLHDAPRSAELYELLLPFERRNVVTPFSDYDGPVSRYLGILAATRGEWDAASSHLRTAHESASRAGAPVVTMHLRIDEARMLTARRRAGDRERALALLSEAEEDAAERGMKQILERIEQLREEAGGAAIRARAPSAPATPAPVTADLVREGDVWAFEFGDRSVRVRDSKGVRYLAVLLSAPGIDRPALELTRGDPDPRDRRASGSAAEGLETRAAGVGDAGPVLDAQARSAYRRRLEELREELEEAESFNDPERAARAREEMEFLATELAGAVGLGGRERRAGSGAERARISVTKAIRSTIKRVAQHDPELGRELDATIRTGSFCRYEPDPRRPVVWRVESG